MGKIVKVAAVSDLPPGQSKYIQAEGKEICLFNVGGTFFAIDNTCTHSGGPLSEGMVEGGEVECPWHGARFDVKSGKVLSGPAREDLASYPVRVNGTEIEIEL